MSKNYCYGCLISLPLENKIHWNGNNPVLVCQKDLYEDDKSDNIDIGLKIVALMFDTIIEIKKFGYQHPGCGYSCAKIAERALNELNELKNKAGVVK